MAGVMEKKAKWIWYYGDYEIFHSLLLHERRQEFGADYPTFWNQSHVYPTVTFLKQDIFAESDGSFRVRANGKAYVILDGHRYPTDREVAFGKGLHTISVRVTNPRGLPAIFAEGDIVTDESWKCGFAADCFSYVGCTPEYNKASDDVEVFPFSYERKKPLTHKKTDLGYLYDFGEETFGYLYIEGKLGDITVFYGESEEEAMAVSGAESGRSALVFESVSVKDKVKLAARAFRYIHIACTYEPDKVYMDYEYLPLPRIGEFECSDPLIKEIYRLSEYTFRLNSREFYLDGIKRDRWVWSGDAYQSCMINRYLYSDAEIIKRTILALLGKPPYYEHINTINDYTFYLIITVYDYWYSSGDRDFVCRIYDRLYKLYEFAVSRLDENGFVCQRSGDWIFIDWAELDKEGPMCAEQILLWQASRCMRKLAALCGAQCRCAPDTDKLRKQIYDYYYKPEKGGFIDGYKSGKELINRQQNVLALLYHFTSDEESALIMEKVLCNPDISPITTPYFEFFELMAMCEYGNLGYAKEMLSSYWGGMLGLGATSVWEAYDPSQSGSGHYEMYGHSFGKSLCHAWGSGPVYILGRYIAGVKNLTPGGETFEVRPAIGVYESFRAVVPVRDGRVEIELDGGEVRVFSDVDGGTLVLGGRRHQIVKGETLKVII